MSVKCANGGPRTAQEAFERLTKELNGNDHVSYAGLDVIRDTFFGDETITVYLNHDCGTDPIFRLDKEWHFTGPTTYSFEKVIMTSSQDIWRSIDLEDPLCSDQNALTYMELIWYSYLFTLELPE